MSRRFILHSFVCLAFVVQMVRAADSSADDMTRIKVNATSSTFLPSSEPGRAMMFFSGVLAMVFTYRRAWLNWKAAPKS